MITKSSFEDDLYNLLVQKKYEIILEFLKNSENEEFIKSNAWNLINKVCLTLKTNTILEHESDLVLCKKILLHIIRNGSPKEVIVALMEEADAFKEHAFFCLLLDPLKETLKKVPSKRSKSLEWVLSTLNAHIQTLSLPDNLDLQGEEKLLLDATPAVMDTNYVLSHYFEFIEFFVDEVSFEALDVKKDNIEAKIKIQQEILQRYILILFGHPLLYHDLHVYDEKKPKSTTRTLCENYMKCLGKISHNVFNLFKYDQSSVDKHRSNDDNDDMDTVPPLALANLSYLIFVEKLAINFQPFILSHKYLFRIHLKYIILLLSKVENLVLFKGLHLSHVLLDQLDDLDLSYDLIELDLFTKFPRGLLNIAIFSQINEFRNLAVNTFLLYVSKCDWKGRYHLIMQVVCTTNHSGCEGLAINLYKDYLHFHLTKNTFNAYFLGKNLLMFLKKIILLKEGVETDLLENSDKIITTLNFLRYLFLRDKKEENQTGIWNLKEDISKTFLQPLSKGIDLSRAHYKEAAKNAGLEHKNKKTKDINATVTVNNEVLPNIPPDFQTGVFKKALLTFDMLESLVSRVRELMD